MWQRRPGTTHGVRALAKQRPDHAAASRPRTCPDLPALKRTPSESSVVRTPSALLRMRTACRAEGVQEENRARARGRARCTTVLPTTKYTVLSETIAVRDWHHIDPIVGAYSLEGRKGQLHGLREWSSLQKGLQPLQHLRKKNTYDEVKLWRGLRTSNSAPSLAQPRILVSSDLSSPDGPSQVCHGISGASRREHDQKFGCLYQPPSTGSTRVGSSGCPTTAGSAHVGKSLGPTTPAARQEFVGGANLFFNDDPDAPTPRGEDTVEPQNAVQPRVEPKDSAQESRRLAFLQQEDNNGSSDESENERPVEVFTEEEINAYAVVFNSYDDDGSGDIDPPELGALLYECFGVAPSLDLVREILEDIDKDHTGTLDFDEFLLLMEHYKHERDVAEEARAFFSEEEAEEYLKVFKASDKDGSGKLTVRELDPVLRKMGKAPKNKLEQKTLLKVLKEVDKNGDGTLDFPEFLQLLRRFIDEGESEMRWREQVAMDRSGLDPEEVEGYREVFVAIDEERKGILNFPDVRRLLRALGLQLDAREAEQLRKQIGEVDQENDPSSVNFVEFLYLMKNLCDINFCGIIDRTKGILTRMEDDRRRVQEREAKGIKTQEMRAKKRKNRQKWLKKQPTYSSFVERRTTRASSVDLDDGCSRRTLKTRMTFRATRVTRVGTGGLRETPGATGYKLARFRAATEGELGNDEGEEDAPRATIVDNLRASRMERSRTVGFAPEDDPDSEEVPK